MLPSIFKFGILPRSWPYKVAATLVVAAPPYPGLLSLEERLEFLLLKAFGLLVGLLLGGLLAGKQVRFSSRRNAALVIAILDAIVFFVATVAIVKLLPYSADYFDELCGLAFVQSISIGLLMYLVGPTLKIVSDAMPGDRSGPSDSDAAS